MPASRSSLARRLSLTATAALLALAGTGVRAQSLQELYEAARAYDANYLAARALAESAQYKAEQANALRRPSAALTAQAVRQETDPQAGVSSINPSGQRVGANNLSATINASHPLYNRGNDATIGQAERQLAIAKADLETAEQDLIVAVAQAYFDVLAAQDALASAKANKAGVTEQLASAKRNFEVGTATITDTREAQARFDLATAQEIAAENDLRTKRIALDQKVGRTGVAPKGLAVPVALPAVAPADAEAWVNQAEGGHPGIRKARLGQEIARLESDKARAAGRPTVDAIASLGGTKAGTGSVIPAVPSSATTYQASLGVRLNWTLYSGDAVQNRLKETVVLEEKARNDLEAARRTVAQATRQAYFGVQSGIARVKALEAAEASTKLALEATQLGYKVGVRVNLDVLNAQTQLYSTQSDLAKARYDVIVGSLRLRQASGQLSPADVNAVNALIAR